MSFQPTAIPVLRVQRYIDHAHLRMELAAEEITDYAFSLLELVKSIALSPLDAAAVERLYVYKVPELKPDGCSRIDGVLDKEAYDLRATLGLNGADDLRQRPESRQLFILDQLVERVALDTGVNWLGFYQRRSVASGEALVKLVYRGAESRAEFPLTREFARLSNNSNVGMTGKAVVINDIERYLWEQGGPYYQCDSKVHSEACLPVFSAEGDRTIGIIDAEAFERDRFIPTTLNMLAATALVLENILAPL